ncbi:iron-sulfur cluster assembly scaffold protein [archaeon]|nr:iron-sulfur cluster assembly scaffold protein [archaeon]|tara:strand:- start:939 stop:1301 length:363 start_codon:yes stop_codon:yes gene_type:complete
MYTKKVMKHFQKPKNYGEMKDADAIGTAGNERCGDILKIYLKIKNNKIQKISFETFGCPAAISASDVLCELCKGKTLKQALNITAKDISEYLGDLPKLKQHCSVLGKEALKKAIEDYKKN